MSSQEHLFSRRKFIILGRGVLVLVGLSTVFPIGKYLAFGDKRTEVERFSKDEIKLTNKWQRVADTRFWLRQGEERPEAIWATCTHLGCEVRFDPGKDLWVCPCHGSKYSFEGKPISGPAKFPLPMAKVEEQKGYFLLKPPV
ncbi:MULTISPECIES: Rieske 2Fe-2S domain-containing protein [unclassified Desulfosporosinus]|uniref:QcrA and Rieske domain-containing protein n=1 Tax=unclassified Desulfosporosinus TaxID=2633794 RepID=UPI000B4A1754|nr:MULTISPECIES: Rieske 2Fe-2S domain-containing protein [unclassified Desulfosporosinus]